MEFKRLIMQNLRRLLFIIILGLFLVSGLPKASCQGCAGPDEPCSVDGALGTCCTTYTPNDGPNAGQTRKLVCSTDPKTAGTCVDDGPAG
jgi:hypothetical protein